MLTAKVIIVDINSGGHTILVHLVQHIIMKHSSMLTAAQDTHNVSSSLTSCKIND